MSGGFLYVLELRAVFERRGNERRAHQVSGVAAVEPELGGVFAHHAIDRVGVHSSAFVPGFAIVVQWPEQGSVDVGSATRKLITEVR